jgi:hypoxanthine phosphoribosyltransferase
MSEHDAPSLLVVKTDRAIHLDQRQQIMETLEPLADTLGAKVLIVDDRADAGLTINPGPLIDALRDQVEAINRLVQSQGAMTAAIGHLAATFVDPEEPVRAIGLDGKPL